jgi:hypothetical protein
MTKQEGNPKISDGARLRFFSHGFQWFAGEARLQVAAKSKLDLLYRLPKRKRSGFGEACAHLSRRASSRHSKDTSQMLRGPAADGFIVRQPASRWVKGAQ